MMNPNLQFVDTLQHRFSVGEKIRSAVFKWTIRGFGRDDTSRLIFYVIREGRPTSGYPYLHIGNKPQFFKISGEIDLNLSKDFGKKKIDSMPDTGRDGKLTSNPQPLRVKPCNRCIKCQGNPLRRNCECLGKMVNKEPMKRNQMVARVGWDNIILDGRPAYLHMSSDTKITNPPGGARISWRSKCHPDTGGRKHFFIKNNDIIDLMKRAETYLGST